MLILHIDTEKLRAAVTSAKRTNEAIDEAVKLLNQVVEHNDWKCVERIQINENTTLNLQMAQEIQKKAAAFYSAVDQASAKFDEVEQRSITAGNSVDEPISQIVNVIPGTIRGAGAALSIASFETIKDSLEG